MNTSMNVGLRILTAAALLISTLLPVSTTSAGEQPPVSHRAASPQIAFEKFTLSNGLQVILHVDRKLPVVHVNEVFHVGSKDEQVRRTGFAQLFEHMMFQGSANVPDEYFSYIGKGGCESVRRWRERYDRPGPHALFSRRYRPRPWNICCGWKRIGLPRSPKR